jgi:hypothetical protein
MSADVRQALVDTPIGLSREQLFAGTGAPDERKFFALVSSLKGSGKIKVGGERGAEPYYILADWPESALRENFDSNKPTRRTVTAKEFAAQGGDDMKPEKKERKKRKRPNGEAHTPDPSLTGDIEAQFAISAQGDLGIEKADAKIKLNKAELVALLDFTEKTESVWKGT